jgi:HlyD family secretion protein
VAVRPGKAATLSAELMGKLLAVHVVEGQTVKKGDLLAEIDRKEYEGALREAMGSAGEAYARLKARRDDVRRSQNLVSSGALPKQDGDRAREERAAAEGRLVASNGAATRARALLSKTRIVAPIDGVVVSRLAEPSETVSPGQRLFVVADLDARRVEVEVDEYDVPNVRLGADAEVRVEGIDAAPYHGMVEEIPNVVGPRQLRPHDPARPTDSAVLLAKVSLPRDTPLKIGQRVKVTLSATPRGER